MCNYLPGEVGGGVESNRVSYVAICEVIDVYSLNALRIAFCSKQTSMLAEHLHDHTVFSTNTFTGQNTLHYVMVVRIVPFATLPYLTFTFMYLLLLYPMLPYTTFTYIPRGGTGVIPP